MPRQLPWLVGPRATKQASSRPKAAAASPAPPPSLSPAPSHRPSPIPKIEETRDRPRESRRSLFMIEGINHDDQYRMVEDEFLAVAGEFTRHLHTAEYQRLKGLAKSQNAETIQNISRPVTEEMTNLVKRRHAALDTASKQREGIAKTLSKRAASADTEENEPQRQVATSLQGLMDSPRKRIVPLTSIINSRPGSSYRVGADANPSKRRSDWHGTLGVKRNHSVAMPSRTNRWPSLEPKSEPSTESDEDDLDGQFHGPLRHSLHRPEPGEPANERPRAPRPMPKSSSPRNPFLETTSTRLQTLAHGTSASEQIATPIDDDDDDDDDDPLSRLRARRAEQKRRRQNQTQGSNTKMSDTQEATINSIPFL
ncbi:hypothetical protein C7999DRAFT_14051 [Corynascus novoguineensis]|uniref:Uncharacterized protein n=1 Tax=Corynascus novoguineensis TaxID=1126955 RepID=A0AAN7HPG6_9PEZI|nr:hypothetical protein C7999DRAFT_14051 [Corynascus novoguineensis]